MYSDLSCATSSRSPDMLPVLSAFWWVVRPALQEHRKCGLHLVVTYKENLVDALLGFCCLNGV